MQAEALDATFLGDAIGFNELIVGQAVFRFFRLTDDVVASNEVAGIVAERQAVGEACAFFQIVDMGDVVEVDDRAEFPRLLEFVGGGVVRRQHYFLAPDARHLRQEQLGQRAAIRPRAFLGEELQDVRVWRRFHREMLAEGRRPRERREEPPQIFSDGRLVINMERRRIAPYDFFQFVFRDGKYFLWHGVPPHRAIMILVCVPKQNYYTQNPLYTQALQCFFLYNA